jgi:L-amino acid N-acyltransferase YncA
VDGLKIRLATAADLPAINDIYNHYVLESTCTYQEAPETPADRAAWFADHDASHPVTVAEADGSVVGWGALSVYKPRTAYHYTVEDSVYVRHDHLRRGIGRALLADLIERARALRYHTMIASIDGGQGPSIALHEALGFAKVAHLREVGFKFGRRLDVVYLQLMLEQS